MHRADLEREAKSDTSNAGMAVRQLVTAWPNETTRDVLVEVVRSGDWGAGEAVEQLVTHWRDEGTRKLLVELALSGRYRMIRAVTTLATPSPDHETSNRSKAVVQLSVSAGSALRELATHWPNEDTRELLVKVAQSDKIAAGSAIRLLAQHWPDEDTRTALMKLVKVDYIGGSVAIEQLAVQGHPQAVGEDRAVGQAHSAWRCDGACDALAGPRTPTSC